MSFKNSAAWLPEKGARLKVDSAEAYTPGPGEILVRNRAVAINPVDYKLQDHGFFIETYPTIIGSDLAGEVAAVGSGVTTVKVGQRVLGHALALATKKHANASFQIYTVVPAQAAAPLPEDISFEAAAVLPLAISTAAAGLYSESQPNLPFPSHHPKSTGKTLLVWGGSSSVGSATIQLAVASGIGVVTTASKKNFEMVKGLGAKEVFDYNAPGIVDELVAYLKNKTVVGGYDAIAEGETGTNVAQVLAQLGGGFFASSLAPPEDLPATVSSKWLMAPTIHLSDDDKQIGKAVFVDFLAHALKTGQLKPAPKAKVVGQGLESVQQGVDLLKKGVSATKLVITL